MIGSQNNRTRGVTIETLESRTFLSASAVPTVIKHAVHPAKVKLTVPALAGASYYGTATSNVGYTANVLISITGETKTGALKGTLTVSNVPVGTGQYKLTGTVSVKKKLALRAKLGRAVITITGAVSSLLNAITGKYFAPGLTTSARGTVSTTLVTGV